MAQPVISFAAALCVYVLLMKPKQKDVFHKQCFVLLCLLNHPIRPRIGNQTRRWDFKNNKKPSALLCTYTFQLYMKYELRRHQWFIVSYHSINVGLHDYEPLFLQCSTVHDSDQSKTASTTKKCLKNTDSNTPAYIRSLRTQMATHTTSTTEEMSKSTRLQQPAMTRWPYTTIECPSKSLCILWQQREVGGLIESVGASEWGGRGGERESGGRHHRRSVSSIDGFLWITYD